MAADWTAEQIEAVIPDAIRDHDFKAVEQLIAMLALRAPDRAQAILDTIELGLVLANDQGGT